MACAGGKWMNSKPSWLPEIFIMDGNWETKIIELYQIFFKDFEVGKPSLRELELWWDRRILDGIYPEGFWHITTRGSLPNRFPDFRRSERMPWCAPSITHCTDPIIKEWDYRESRAIRTYVWLENYDYVVILEKRKHRKGMIAFLITAYHVDGDRTRLQLRQKYDHRIN
jgi:hypothetical protein